MIAFELSGSLSRYQHIIFIIFRVVSQGRMSKSSVSGVSVMEMLELHDDSFRISTVARHAYPYHVPEGVSGYLTPCRFWTRIESTNSNRPCPTRLRRMSDTARAKSETTISKNHRWHWSTRVTSDCRIGVVDPYRYGSSIYYLHFLSAKMKPFT